MMPDTLDQARAQLRRRLGTGARFDAEAAPGEALLTMRLARAACQRQISLISDRDLQRPDLARIVAELGCTARLIAESFETLSGHAGIEGDSAERSGILATEITLARTLPGRALRSLYLHALQHLDVACRDLDAEGWRAGIAIPHISAATPEAALVQMAENLRAAAENFQNHTLRPHGTPQ
jgi:maleylpyruvate isomerase